METKTTRKNQNRLQPTSTKDGRPRLSWKSTQVTCIHLPSHIRPSARTNETKQFPDWGLQYSPPPPTSDIPLPMKTSTCFSILMLSNSFRELYENHYRYTLFATYLMQLGHDSTHATYFFVHKSYFPSIVLFQKPFARKQNTFQ